MPAECWACGNGLSQVQRPGQGPPSRDPVGSCFYCYVFGCAGHGERRVNAAKWICYQCVAQAVAVKAGLTVRDSGIDLAIGSVQDLEDAFPLLAAAIGPVRERWAGPVSNVPLDALAGEAHDPVLLATATALLEALGGPTRTAAQVAQTLGLDDAAAVVREVERRD